MDMQTNIRLLRIAAACLVVAGLLFLCLAIAKIGGEWMLPAALIAILLGNLFILIAAQRVKKNDNNQ